ncbi:MAG TPA: flagellar export protein FliJ [Burkholderiales bacterium]|nr:flagellar export protein FliJ [Burkholderiales bacterium]
MPRPFRLRPVLDLAQQRLETATLELQKLAARRDEAQVRLDQLADFLRSYRAELDAALRSGVDAIRLRDFQAFVTKLERAIELQSTEVQRCRSAWEAEHRSWLALRSKEQAFAVLQERHALEEARREGRGEQKQQDEFASRNGSGGKSEG